MLELQIRMLYFLVILMLT